MNRLILFLATIAIAFPAAADEIRLWMDVTGKFQITASLDSVKDGNARLITTDGRTLNVPVSRLSAQDQAYVKGLHAKRLDDLRHTHTTWQVRVVKYETHQEADVGYHVHHVMPGVNQAIPHELGTTHTVSTKHYVVEPVAGELVSYQRTDVVLRTHRGLVTFTYGNLGKADQEFLTAYRKAEKGE